MAIGKYTIRIAEGAALDALEKLGASVGPGAAQAINKTADRTRTASDREMRSQLNFTASYLAPSAKRLFVSRRAAQGSLEAVISARFRPTSLARFTVPGKGVTVQVGPTKRITLGRAFLVKLRAGTADIETRSNLGLAVRTNGPPPRGAYKPSKFGKNAWLVYGPSVAQAFRTVGEKVAPNAARFLEIEFLRLIRLQK